MLETSETEASARILTPWRAWTERLLAAEATVTSAPDRRRTSMAMTASIGSVPSAIGSKTFRAFEVAMAVVEVEEIDRGREKEKRLRLSLGLGVKFVEASVGVMNLT